jgi:hypothetical protein
VAEAKQELESGVLMELLKSALLAHGLTKSTATMHILRIRTNRHGSRRFTRTYETETEEKTTETIKQVISDLS